MRDPDEDTNPFTLPAEVDLKQLKQNMSGGIKFFFFFSLELLNFLLKGFIKYKLKRSKMKMSSH